MFFGLILHLALLSSGSLDGSFIITGTVKYIDGDRLLVDCGKAEPCLETMVRDERFRREVLGLQGKKVTLRVRRVDACGSESNQVACVRSLDRTALSIVEWIAVD